MLPKPKKNKFGVTTIKQARPKMHIILAADINSKEQYDNLILRLMKYLPIIDPRAKDAAHFFFGTENPKIEIIDGHMTLNELLDELDFDNYDSGDDEIPEGQRNATMHRYAVKVLKRYGDSEEAETLFDEKASHCIIFSQT